MSANDKGDNKLIPETVHKSPGICLTIEKNPSKPQLGDSLVKAVRRIIASNEVSEIAQHIRKGVRRYREQLNIWPAF